MLAIDRAELDAQTGGDAELAHEVLALFAGQCRSILPRLTDPALPGPPLDALAEAVAAGNLAVAGVADLTESIARQALVRGFDRVMLYGGLCAWAFAGASRLVLGRNGR